MPGDAWNEEKRTGRTESPRDRKELGNRPPLPIRSIDPDRHERRQREETEHDLEAKERTTERGCADEGNDRADRER